MTDVLKTPEKKTIRRALIAAALTALERDGWKVQKEKGGVRGRIRTITKAGRTQLAAIRTSQDTWIAFPRNEHDTKWATLSDVDVVVAASVDDAESPKFAQVHMFDAKELGERFDRAYSARKKAGYSITLGRGVWISLYREESNEPVVNVGAGIGLVHEPFARMPLADLLGSNGSRPPVAPPKAEKGSDDSFQSLIAQAKESLARELGVDPGSIRITVEA